MFGDGRAMAELDASDPKAFASDRVSELAREQVLFLGKRRGVDLERYHWGEPFTTVPPVGTPRWVRRDRALLPRGFAMVVWQPETGVRSTCDVIDEHIARLVIPTPDNTHGLTTVGPTRAILDRLVQLPFARDRRGAILALVRDRLVKSPRFARHQYHGWAPRPPRGYRWERLPGEQYRHVHLLFDDLAGHAVQVTPHLVPSGLPELPERPGREEVVALLMSFLELTRPLLYDAGSD